MGIIVSFLERVVANFALQDSQPVPDSAEPGPSSGSLLALRDDPPEPPPPASSSPAASPTRAKTPSLEGSLQCDTAALTPIDRPSLLSTPSPLECPNPFENTLAPPPNCSAPAPSALGISAVPLLDATDLPAAPARAGSASPPPDTRPSPPDLRIAIPLPDAEPPLPSDGIPSPDTLDMCFDDEGLSTLEKIYLFSRSQASFHKVYIAHAMPSILPQVTPIEAVEYVLPLLNGLALDDDEAVKEALAMELVPIMWWFASNCRVTDDETADPMQDPPPLLVQAFTPILGTLLLSPCPPVGASARTAVVDILRRMRETEPALGSLEASSEDTLFGPHQRQLFEQEILQQVVIGIGRLDMPDDADAPGSAIAVDAQPEEVEAHAHAGVPPVQMSPISPLSPASASMEQEPSLTAVPSSMLPSRQSHPLLSPLPQPYKSPSSFASSDDSTPDLTPPDFSTSSSGDVDMSPSTPPSPVDTFSQSFNASSKPTDLQMPSASEFMATPSSKDASSPLDWAPPDTHFIHIDEMSSSASSSPPLAQAPTSRSAAGTFLAANSPSLENGSSESSAETTSMDIGQSEEADTDAAAAAEQAALGRLSSMSLMAAVSASAGACLGDATKIAFVKEVERVGHDPIWWVRKEASFALGALARLVPVEVLVISLVPLFDSLVIDAAFQVRQSALYALPAILPRLSPSQRRTLSLKTILPLARDDSPIVRTRVLEALGEVMHTFREDAGGPPDELLLLFLGKARDSRPAMDAHPPAPIKWPERQSPAPFAPMVIQIEPPEGEDDEPQRPLICAFNYPAVALTLGRERWPELRPLYVRLAESPVLKVRRTLAASAGEMARIIGPAFAARDVLPMWRNAIRAPESEVRMKAVEAMGVLVQALPEQERLEMVRMLEERWGEGLGGYREKEAAAKELKEVVGIVRGDAEAMECLCVLVGKALQDEVAAVREAGVGILATVFDALVEHLGIRERLSADVCSLARSPAFRRRMTFVACYQALVMPEDVQMSESLFASFWQCLAELSRDTILNVRIGVARLIGLMSDPSSRSPRSSPPGLHEVLRHLREDPSHEVRSYVPMFSKGEVPPNSPASPPSPSGFATFSRPPPASPFVPTSVPGASPRGAAVAYINRVEQRSGQAAYLDS